MKALRPCTFLAICLFARLLLAEPLLKDGDRMVFCGDSITDQMQYTRMVMDYFALRFPGMKLIFFNAGISGSTAGGWKDGVDQHILSRKPTVVSVCLGMNDGQYHAFDEKIAADYVAGMTAIVKKIKAAGARVVLLTPGVIDDDRISPSRGKGVYNDTLARYARAVEEIAAREQVPVFNIYTLMLDVQTRAKAQDPAFTMIPDGVHPAAPGHALMAYGLLKALGSVIPASALTIDAPRGTATPQGCKVTDLQVTDDRVAFTRTDDALPTYFPPEALQAIGKLTTIFDELSDYRLAVTGLKAGTWKLTVANRPVGSYPAEDLAKGVNLAAAPGPWQQLAKTVDDRAAEASRQYYIIFHGLGARHFPQAADAPSPQLRRSAIEIEAARVAFVEKLVQLYETAERARADIPAADRTWRWTLTAAP